MHHGPGGGVTLRVATGRNGGGASILTGRSTHGPSGLGTFVTGTALRESGRIKLTSGLSASLRGGNTHVSAGSSPSDVVGATIDLIAGAGTQLGGRVGIEAAHGDHGSGGHASFAAGPGKLRSGCLLLASIDTSASGTGSGDCSLHTGAAVAIGPAGKGIINTGMSPFGSGGSVRIMAGRGHRISASITMEAGLATYGGSSTWRIHLCGRRGRRW